MKAHDAGARLVKNSFNFILLYAPQERDDGSKKINRHVSINLDETLCHIVGNSGHWTPVGIKHRPVKVIDSRRCPIVTQQPPNLRAADRLRGRLCYTFDARGTKSGRCMGGPKHLFRCKNGDVSNDKEPPRIPNSIPGRHLGTLLESG